MCSVAKEANFLHVSLKQLKKMSAYQRRGRDATLKKTGREGPAYLTDDDDDDKDDGNEARLGRCANSGKAVEERIRKPTCVAVC